MTGRDSGRRLSERTSDAWLLDGAIPNQPFCRSAAIPRITNYQWHSER
jgi:hypothetical protein